MCSSKAIYTFLNVTQVSKYFCDHCILFLPLLTSVWRTTTILTMLLVCLNFPDCSTENIVNMWICVLFKEFQCGSENEQQTGCDKIHSEEAPQQLCDLSKTVQSRKKEEEEKKRKKKTRIVKISRNVHKKKYGRVHVSGLSYWGASSLLYSVCMSCVYVQKIKMQCYNCKCWVTKEQRFEKITL